MSPKMLARSLLYKVDLGTMNLSVTMWGFSVWTVEPDLEMSELVDLGDSGSKNLKPVFQLRLLSSLFKFH